MSLTLINYTSNEFETHFIQSLRTLDFAVLINHPIDQKLILETQQQWKFFFNSETKYQYQCDSTKLDGYFPFGLEDASAGNYQDLKEYYYFYVWGKCPASLKEITLMLFNQLVNLSKELLSYIEASLPENIRKQMSTSLVNMVNQSPRIVLRILHYPPLQNISHGHVDDDAIRAVEHEDLSLISLVSAISGAGLQAMDKEGIWYDIPPGPEYLTVNIGEMLDMCTGGYYKGTTHRVVNPKFPQASESRYANAFFLNPHDHVVLRDGVTAADCLQRHIHKRLHALEITETAPELA